MTKKDQTNNTAAKQDLIDFDSWSSDMLNKPQDKTSIVKQGVQTLQLVSCFSENIFLKNPLHKWDSDKSKISIPRFLGSTRNKI